MRARHVCPVQGPTEAALCIERHAPSKSRRAALKAHRDRQTFARQALGDGYDDLGLVFANELGRPLDPDNVTKRFKSAVKGASLPPMTRLHDLRHGAATMLLEAGEPVPSVAAYLGHASAADRLESILRSARTAIEFPAEGDVAAG